MKALLAFVPFMLLAAAVLSLEVQRRGVSLERGTAAGWVVTGMAGGLLLFIRLPLLHDTRSFHYLLLLPLIAACAWMWPRAQRSASPGLLLVFVAYLALIDVAVMRRGHGISDAIAYTVVGIFAVLLLSSARDDRERRVRLLAVALAPGIYATVNVLMHLAGMQPPGGVVSVAAYTPSKLLSAVGVGGLRTQFPLGTGINAFGVIAAVGLAGAAVVWQQTRGAARALASVCIASCLYCCAYSDTRGAVAAAIGVLILFRIFQRIKPIRWLVVVVPLSPFVMTWLIGQLAALGLGSALSRQGNDFATGTNRFYIWQGALKVLRHFDPVQLVGWGASGQIKSGASLNYSYLFRNQVDQFGAPTHNFMIQTVMDTGYLGLAVTVLLFAGTLIRLEGARRMEPDSPVSAILAMVLVVMLAGLTEALPTATVGQEALVMTIVAMGVAVQPSMLAAVAPAPARAKRGLRASPAYASMR